MTLGKRIKERREELKMTQSKLAETIGIRQPTLSDLEKGVNNNTTKLLELSNALGVSPEWLMYGKNPDASIEAISSDDEIIGMDAWDDDTPLQMYEVEIPFLKNVHLSAGSGCFEMEDFDGRKLRFSKRTLKNNGVDPENAVCVTAKGDSMEPVIPNNCTVAVDRGDTEVIDGQIYAVYNDGLLQIKLLKWISGSELSIESYNNQYAPVRKRIDEIKIMGRVFWYSVLIARK